MAERLFAEYGFLSVSRCRAGWPSGLKPVPRHDCSILLRAGARADIWWNIGSQSSITTTGKIFYHFHSMSKENDADPRA